MRYVVIGTLLICAGIFLWPLILRAGSQLSEQFSAVWNSKEQPEPSELDNTTSPISTDLESTDRETEEEVRARYRERS